MGTVWRTPKAYVLPTFSARTKEDIRPNSALPPHQALLAAEGGAWDVPAPPTAGFPLPWSRLPDPPPPAAQCPSPTTRPSLPRQLLAQPI